MRAIIAYMEQTRGVDAQAYAEAFQFLSGLMAWNLQYGNFDYYHNPTETDGTQGKSSGTGLTMVDPQAWYYWHTGLMPYWNHLAQYLNGGINGGRGPYGVYNEWCGQFESRMYNFVLQTPRLDATPPPPISDLTATQTGNTVLLDWTTPADANLFHIVWSDRPISQDHTTDLSLRNWWAAETAGTRLPGTPGRRQTLQFTVEESPTQMYVAVFSFDADENMSDMSNVAMARNGQIGPPIVICFPGDAVVQTEDSGFVTMKDIGIGDKILVDDRGKFEQVYAFGHRDEDIETVYLRFRLSDDAVFEVSGQHMVFLESGSSVPASTIRIGFKLVLTNGDVSQVESIETVKKHGAYAPFTASAT